MAGNDDKPYNGKTWKSVKMTSEGAKNFRVTTTYTVTGKTSIDIDVDKALAAADYLDVVVTAIEEAKTACEKVLAKCGDNVILTDFGNPCGPRIQTAINNLDDAITSLGALKTKVKEDASNYYKTTSTVDKKRVHN